VAWIKVNLSKGLGLDFGHCEEAGKAALGDGDKAGELFALLNPCISTPVSRARGGALRSRSAITRRATTSSSRTPTAWRGGWRLLRSMAYRSRGAARLSRSPMTAQRTRCVWSLGQRLLVRQAALPCNGEKQTTARSHHRQHRVLVQDSSVQIYKNVAYGP
jgi:hypothetical protein